MPFPLFETKQLNNKTRKSAGGAFVQLTGGVTHYELSNDSPLPKGEELGVRDIVFVHGFSVPYFIFDPTFEFLTQSGFRVLRYDLFGRGFSDRPRVRYNMDFFIKQLLDLLNALRFTHNVNLVGLSMGGPITATFTARYPERIRSLTLIDPAGVRPVSLSPTFKALKVRNIKEAGFGAGGIEVLIKMAAKDFYDPKLIGLFMEKYKVQMQYKGFKRGILSTLRNNVLKPCIETYKQVDALGKPVLLLWGRNDVTVPFEYSNDLRAAMPKAEFHVIEDCAHIPHYEKPDYVNPILLDFLRR